MARHGGRVLALTLVALLVLPVAAQATSFSQLIVFGDSLSDNGNVFAATGGTYPPPPYAQRFSNGPVAVEYLAQSLGIPLVDFAFGGATTGTANYVSSLLPGMAQELGMYVTSLGGGQADPNALYFLWGGPNDVFLALSLNQNPFAAVAAAANNIAGIAGTLLSMGAQHVLVGGMPDLGLTPAFAGNMAVGTAVTNYYNGLLQNAFSNSPVLFWDAAALQREVIANPAAYGFTNVTSPCFVQSPPSLCGLTLQQQDLYFYWDSVHPTTAGHQVMADSIAAAVPEPASLLLLGTGLIGVVRAVRRKRR